jgi:anaerobic ribonucleoside-triphosphate reductase
MEDCNKYIKEIKRLHEDLNTLYVSYKAMQMITNAQDNALVEYAIKEARKRLDVLDIKIDDEESTDE